jgi:SH3 domain-containing YSC84-like protein 1
MKKLLCLMVFSSVLMGSLALASAREDSTERLKMSTEVLQAIMAAPDNGIPEEVLDNAKCMMVIPHMIKGGFIFGGEHGRGIATCRTSKGWSAPAFVSVGGGSAGLQIGLEGVDVVLLIMNSQGLQHLLSSKFQLSGEGSVAAGPIGRHASAGTDWKLNTELLSYSRSKGVFAGLTLNGAVVKQDDDSTRAIYRSKLPFRTVLSGKTATPAVAAEFMRAVSAAGHQARAQEAKEEAKEAREQAREEARK